MKYLVANWKAHQNLSDVNTWLDGFVKHDFSVTRNKAQIIVCPSYSFIPLVKERLKDYGFCHVGAQDVSVFEKGAFTGEVGVYSLAGLVDYVLIGHSERRRHFGETTQTLLQKADLCLQYEIEPIFCIRNGEDVVPSDTRLVAYEPERAIGTGQNASLEQILSVRSQLRLNQDSVFLYGGSVDEQNISRYLNCDQIDGLLVGSASLDASAFFNMIKQIQR